jgi:hypothetical protein
MQAIKTVAIKFLDGIWQIVNIPVPQAANGDTLIPLNLDAFFTDRSTSINFKGYGQQGRMLFMETNRPRRVPMKAVQDMAGQHYRI